MADKASTSLSASILLDEIKTSMSGVCQFSPADSGDKWIFTEVDVSSSHGDLITTIDFLATDTATVTGDKVRWLAVKNLSTVDTDGVCISLDGGTPAFDLVDGIFIGTGEMIVIKCPNTTMGNLHARSVTMDGTYGYPSAVHAGTVKCHVAAIIDDVSV